uniref:Uncharacterized protein n=1 Tax=Arundo donax TaxID=35708 RepID=A0A0A9B708_ARUDO
MHARGRDGVSLGTHRSSLVQLNKLNI